MGFRRILFYVGKYWREVLVLVMAAGFLVATSFFNIAVQEEGFVKWGSPDENANYVFSMVHSFTGEPVIFEEYNLHAEGIIRPRSVRSIHGALMPVSFPGMVLIFGGISSIVGYEALPFLTPVFAAVAIFFYYLLMREIFGRRNALISAFLLAVFPVFIYYTARSMFHNVLFVSLLVMSLYFSYGAAAANRYKPKFFSFSLKHINGKSWIFAALGGIFVGLAASVRTSELLWMIPGGFILWIFNMKKLGIVKLVILLSAAFLAMMPALYWNQALYGSPLYGGYPEMNNSIEQLKESGGGLMDSVMRVDPEMIPSLIRQIKDTVFYFGFNPQLSHEMFRKYVVEMFPWLFWPAVFGSFWFFLGAGKWKKKHWAYMASYGVISAILIYYYGSWKFHDNPDETSFTIGNSYTRYWLPVYMGALPFVAIIIGKLPEQVLRPSKIKLRVIDKSSRRQMIMGNLFAFLKKRRIWAGTVSLVACLAIGYISADFVLYGSEEGLAVEAEKKKGVKREYERVLEATPVNAVIITRYHDKLFFPQRRVVVGLFDDRNMIANYAKIAEFLPVYYYNFTLPPEAVEYLNQGRLREAGLILEEEERMDDSFTLYRLRLRE